MQTNLQKLRNNCTPREAKFLELWLNGGEKFSVYKQAGYHPKSPGVASANVCRLLKKAQCKAYFQALKDQQDKNTNISRTMQLNQLHKAFKMAQSQSNPSAMISAIREQNEMLGYHRESAPNQEREQARRDIIAKEKNALDRIQQLAQDRTSELSKGDSDISDSGDDVTGDTTNIIKIGETG